MVSASNVCHCQTLNENAVNAEYSVSIIMAG